MNVLQNRMGYWSARTRGARSLLAAVGLSLLLLACSGETLTPLSPAGEDSLPVRAYVVQQRTLERRVQLAAPVEAFRTIAVAARTEAVVSSVEVETGDRVERGQLMALLDVREQRAELARAQASLREATAQNTRLQKLRSRDFIDEASVLAAEAALDAAKADVSLWQARLANGRIEAPIDGVVIARMVEPGAAIGRLESAFELADLEQLVLRVGVSELDAGSLAPGMSVPVRVDALGDAGALPGQIRRVFPAVEAGSRLIQVEIELPQAHALGVRPGFLARADLQVEQRRNVLAVPAGAVGFGESQYVMVIDADDRLVRRPVTTGILRGDWREVTGGLKSGDRIVSSSPLDLAEGERVRVVETLVDDVDPGVGA